MIPLCFWRLEWDEFCLAKSRDSCDIPCTNRLEMSVRLTIAVSISKYAVILNYRRTQLSDLACSPVNLYTINYPN